MACFLTKCKKINPDKILEGRYPMPLLPCVFNFPKHGKTHTLIWVEEGKEIFFPATEISIVLFVPSGLFFLLFWCETKENN